MKIDLGHITYSKVPAEVPFKTLIEVIEGMQADLSYILTVVSDLRQSHEDHLREHARREP